MRRFFSYGLAGMLCAALLTTGALVTRAQDSGSEPVVVGDAGNEALGLVRQFLEDGSIDVLAEDVTYFDRTLPEPIVGRDAFVSAGVGAYGDTFTEFFYQPRRYIVAGSTVVVEFEFTGTPSTPVAAADAEAPLAVAIAMVGIFDVRDGGIQRIDLFYDAAGLQYQLGYDPYYDPFYDRAYPAASAPAAPDNALAGTTAIEVDDLVEDMESYAGGEIIVRGMVGPALNDRAFLLHDDDLLDLAQEEILVIDGSEHGLDFVQMADASVFVSGNVQPFVRADIEAALGLSLDEATFAAYEGLPVLLAERAANLYDVASLENIVKDPAAFYGQTVSIRGDVTGQLGGHGFVMDDDDLIDFDPERILVVMPSAADASALPPVGETIVVTGVVREFARAAFEEEYGLTLDDELYAAYETLPAVVADAVSDGG